MVSLIWQGFTTPDASDDQTGYSRLAYFLNTLTKEEIDRNMLSTMTLLWECSKKINAVEKEDKHTLSVLWCFADYKQHCDFAPSLKWTFTFELPRLINMNYLNLALKISNVMKRIQHSWGHMRFFFQGNSYVFLVWVRLILTVK